MSAPAWPPLPAVRALSSSRVDCHGSGPSVFPVGVAKAADGPAAPQLVNYETAEVFLACATRTATQGVRGRGATHCRRPSIADVRLLCRGSAQGTQRSLSGT